MFNLETTNNRIINYCNKGVATRYDFANEIYELYEDDNIDKKCDFISFLDIFSVLEISLIIVLGVILFCLL